MNPSSEPSKPKKKLLSGWLQKINVIFDEMFFKTHAVENAPQQIQTPAKKNRISKIKFISALEKELKNNTIDFAPGYKKYQQQFKRLCKSLEDYEHFIAAHQTNYLEANPLESKFYWEQLANLREHFGACLLWLCDQEAKLKVNSSGSGKYEFNHHFITVVENFFYQISTIKISLEKQIKLTEKQQELPAKAYHAIYQGDYNTHQSLQTLKKLHSDPQTKTKTLKDRTYAK